MEICQIGGWSGLAEERERYQSLEEDKHLEMWRVNTSGFEEVLAPLQLYSVFIYSYTNRTFNLAHFFVKQSMILTKIEQRAAKIWNMYLVEWRSKNINTYRRQDVHLSQRFREGRERFKFTCFYKTGQNGKGDRLIVWRHFLKRVTLIQRSIMEYQYFIYCSRYTTFLYSVTCVHGNMPTLLQKVFS